jgi:hypothetical protein
MTDLYSRMKDFSKYRFALLSGEGEPNKTYLKLELNGLYGDKPIKPSYAFYLDISEENGKPKEDLYFFDYEKSKLYKFKNICPAADTKISTMEEILKYMQAPEQIYRIFFKQKKEKFLSKDTLAEMRTQLGNINFPGDCFLTISQDSASLDLSAIFEKTRKNIASIAESKIQIGAVQGLGCARNNNGGYDENAVCLELIMAFLDNNKNKKQLTITCPLRLTPEQKKALKEKLKTFPNLNTLSFPDLGYEHTEFSEAKLENDDDDEWMLELGTMSTQKLNEWVGKLFEDMEESKIKIKRLQWMAFLQSKHPWLRHWTAQEKVALLELSCSHYTKRIQAVLTAKNSDNQVKIKAASNLISEFISTKRGVVASFTKDNHADLQQELNASLNAYKKLGGLSSSRVKQVEVLEKDLTEMESSTTCIGLLEKLQNAKKSAMQDDLRINASSCFFKMNRKGHSRFFNTINEMYFLVLKHGADQLDKNYHTYVSTTFQELFLQLIAIPGVDNNALNENQIKQIDTASVGDILSQIRSQMGSMPGHVKTVANEVLLHGSALLTQLESAPKEGEGDKPSPQGGVLYTAPAKVPVV